MFVKIYDRMKNCILICSLFKALYISAADEDFNYDQRKGEVCSDVLKKLQGLEERVRETEVLKERLSDVERQLTNMHELEYRLRMAEEQIWMLVNRVEHETVNRSTKFMDGDTNRTHDTLYTDSSPPIWIKQSSIDSRQVKINDKIHEIVSFKNRVQTATKGTEMKNRKRTITRKAAFTAMFSTHPVSVTPGRSLQFDRVDYNEGNAYDTKTGIFTCPVSGTYFFFTNILSMPHKGFIETEIVFEGQRKGRTHAIKEENYDQGSTAAALHCDAGQRVWIQTAWGDQSWGEILSSFSGFLLWQDDAATNSN